MSSLKEIEEAKLAAKALNEELGYLEDAFTSIGQKIKDEVEYNLIGVTEETKKVGEVFSKNLNSAIKQNANSLKEISKLQDQIGKGVNVEAKIQKELANLATRKKTIARQQNILTANGIKINEDLSKQLNAQFSIQEDTLNTLSGSNVEKQKSKSLLTLLGEGGANLLDKLDKSGTASKLMSLNLKDTVTPMRLMELAIGFVVDAFLSLDATTEKVAQNLGISFHEAVGMNSQFSQIAQDSNNIFVTTEGIANSQIQLSAALGTNAMFTAEMLQTQTELTNQLGLSAETGGEIAKLGLLTGKTSKEIAANVMGQSVAMNAANKTAITEKSILQEVAKLSSSIQLSMGNNPVALAKAVQTAKQFGMELSNVDGIANSLMNFEQSISNELEAELLLGKNLNLEKARTAALNNDLATVAEEIAKQAGSSAEFTAMNRIQQEALAKAVGMTKEDLAKSLQSKEILAKLGGKDADMQAAYNRLKAEGLSQEEIATKLGDERLAQSLHSEGIQSQFTASVAKMKELFVQIAAVLIPIVEPIMAAVGFMANLVSESMTLLKVLGSIIGVYKVMKFLGDGVYRNQILSNIASKLGLVTDQQVVGAKLSASITAKGNLLTENQTALVKKRSLLTSIKDNIQKKLGNNSLLVGLGHYIRQSAIKAKDFILDKAGYLLQLAKNIATGAYNVILGIGNAIKKSGLLSSIAEMAMRAYSSLAAIPFIGPILGIAGAAAAVTLGYMYYNKADDMVSPGAGSGYGSRTITGPEGAIALNNKDTIIAGTDLFNSNNNSTSPTQTVVQQDNSEGKRTNALLEALINKPAPTVQMDSIEVGTVAGMSAFSIQ